MVDGVKHLAGFKPRYDLVCDVVGADILQMIDGGDAQILNRNLVSSLMTVLISTLLTDELRERQTNHVAYLAGYSVGQWSAMYAARMLGIETLLTALTERARLMDECMRAEPGAMSAVIGIPGKALEAEIAELQAYGHRVYVSNYNCFGQYSISGTANSIQLAEERLQQLRPRKIMRLPVSGAWHCPLLTDAGSRFADFLEGIEFRTPEYPIVDNVTAAWLPQDAGQLRKSLASHLYSPVRWEESVKKLVALGSTDFIEVGFGTMLEKFAFFIDRKICSHRC
jgi:[acyl-carrier-protein] S-malonyltransferase